jgi:tetratricopeptide (TPR) repeat protein
MTEQLMERASLLFEQQRYKEAEKNLLEVLAIEPDNISGLNLLAEIKIQNEEYDDALMIINNAIGIVPDYDVLYYTKARILLNQNKIKLALEASKEALSLDPYDPNNHALLGLILNHSKQFEDALNAANEALEIDGSHILALNVRSTALLKLNRKEDSFSTIEGALNEDPNNSYTHANFGWGLLEKGETDKALVHFKEALKNDPNSEFAQAGMAEALKSKYLIYKWFLKYSFWMSNLTSKNQWIFIIGFYLISRVLRSVSESNQALQPYLTPVIILLAIFAFSTWIIQPLSNLLFRLNKFGKHLLTSDEIKSSNLVGISLIILFLGLITMFLNVNFGTAITVFGFTMMIPLSRFFDKPTHFFLSYGIGLLVVGIIALFIVFISDELFNSFTIIYLVGFIAFQWLANYFSIKTN